MELSWPMKLRIAAAAAVGVLLIGILAWPMAEPFSRVGAMASRDAVSCEIKLCLERCAKDALENINKF